MDLWATWTAVGFNSTEVQVTWTMVGSGWTAVQVIPTAAQEAPRSGGGYFK